MSDVPTKARDTAPGRLTICGSMKFYEQMKALRDRLTNQGFSVHIPTQEEIDFSSMSPSEKIRAKKQYIHEHMERIRSSDLILIAN